MTIQTPAIVIPRPRRGSGRRLFIGLAAAALALTVGAGLWLAGRDGGTESATPPAVAVEQPAVVRPVETAATYYLMGSQAEADAMRVNIAQLGEGLLPEVVTVVTTADADAFFRDMRDLNDIRAGFGLPSVTVVDLRTRSAVTERVTTNGLSELDGAPVAPATAATAAAAPPADTLGGLAELIRDGGTPASLGLPTTTGAAEAARPTATSGGQPADVPHFTP